MTILLASVQNQQEAQTALQAGAGIIDIKDPTGGGLAAVSPQTWRQIAQTINRKAPTSAALGNPPQTIQDIMDKAQQADQAGIDIVKIGIATDNQETIELLAQQAQHIKAHTVLVYLIDQTEPTLPDNTRHIAAVMLDTRHKHAQKLTDYMNTQQLKNFIAQARTGNIKAGLAGKLTAQDIPSLLELEPDIIGLRSAITENTRDSGISRQKIEQIKQLFPNQDASWWYNQ